MLPLKIQPTRAYYQSPMSILFIISSLDHVIYSLWICTFAITKFINKILRNQIQYLYISTQVVSGWVMLSDIDGDCRLKLACLVSDNVRLIIIIIWQVRESASSRHSQEWISPRLLALVDNFVNVLHAYLHRRINLPLPLWNLSNDAQKHMRFVIVPQ